MLVKEWLILLQTYYWIRTFTGMGNNQVVVTYSIDWIRLSAWNDNEVYLSMMRASTTQQPWPLGITFTGLKSSSLI